MSENEIPRILERHFPGLADSGYAITSAPSEAYNCIAWAAGDDNRWWWPHPSSFWPAEAPMAETVEALVAAFATIGYSPSASADPEPGIEKVAIYADAAEVPTHAARQLHNGRWTSKLGRNMDIEHTLEALEGTQYGRCAKILARPASGVKLAGATTTA